MTILPPGTLVGLRYRLGDVLGRGGMGTVYAATHLGLGLDVALKIVPPTIGDASATIRFEREARNVARLDHAGSVRVLDVGTTPDGTRYLAMERLSGPTLRERMNEGVAPPGEAVAVALALLDALAHAHARGVVHRDVKPENVILDPRRGPVLIDFGLSWALGDAPITRRGTTVGSPSYLSPERALGQAGDGRSDLYAIGVILYEMLSGRRPFASERPIELAWMHAHAEPPFLGQVAAEVSLPLASLVHRALAKDPAARFADAAEMAAALRAIPLTAAAAAAVAVEPVEEESTSEVPVERSRLRALLGKLRFGRWRWRAG